MGTNEWCVGASYHNIEYTSTVTWNIRRFQINEKTLECESCSLDTTLAPILESDAILYCSIITKHIRVSNVFTQLWPCEVALSTMLQRLKSRSILVNKCETIMSRAWSIKRVGVRPQLVHRVAYEKNAYCMPEQSPVRLRPSRGAEVSQLWRLLNYSNQLTRHGAVKPLVLHCSTHR